jgi:hypothetical protein
MDATPDSLPLSELRKKIKEFKTTSTPKLSSKKSVLAEYATKVGILKPKIASSEPPPPPPPSRPPGGGPPEKAAKASKKVVVSSELPEVLKAPAKSKKSAPVPEQAKKKGSPFSSFMAAHKGKGHSMSELAAMYKAQKK